MSLILSLDEHMLYSLRYVRPYILVLVLWSVVINPWNGIPRFIQLYAFGYSTMQISENVWNLYRLACYGSNQMGIWRHLLIVYILNR